MSFKVLPHAVLLILVAGCGTESTEDAAESGGSAVIDGMQAGPPSAYPEVVQVFVNNAARDYCTGVLIGPKLVMTATHCTGGRSFVVKAPYAPRPAESKATIAGVVAHSSDFNTEIEKEDIAVLALETPIVLNAYPVLRDVGELGAQKLKGVAVGRAAEARNAPLVKTKVLTVRSGTNEGYTTGLSSEYYSSGGDSGGPLFLSDANGGVQHVVIGIERQPEPPGEHFTRITTKVTALVSAFQPH